MESAAPAYRIYVKSSGIVIADNLPRTSPAIQLKEGKPVIGHLHPMALESGGETFVVYPLEAKATLTCRILRIDGLTEEQIASISSTQSVAEPPAEEPKAAPIAVRRGRGVRAT